MRVIREATLHRLIVPVLCGSALDHIGIQPLLDAVVPYLPSPAGRAAGGRRRSRKSPTKSSSARPTSTSRFCGLVFKIQADKHGDLHYRAHLLRAGCKANTRAYNPGKDKKENVSQLWHVQADRREQVDAVEAGDIVGIIGLRHSVTGDTLCDAKRADPAGIDRISRDGHLDGHRAGEHRPSAKSWPTRWRCSSGRIRPSAPPKARKPARR